MLRPVHLIVAKSILEYETPRKVFDESKTPRVFAPKSPTSDQDWKKLAQWATQKKFRVDTLVVGQEKLTEETLSLFPDLKLIAKYGVGINNLPIKALQKYKIEVGLSPGVNAHAVASLVLSNVIQVLRRIDENRSDLLKNRWNRPVPALDLQGQTFGVIGYGHVGSALVRLLSGFPIQILVYEKDPEVIRDAPKSVIFVDETTILKNSDILSIHIPYQTSNHHYIQKKRLDLCRKNLILINTSRGDVVDEDLILKLLDTPKLKNYIADVFKNEPKPNPRLIQHKKVFATAHIGAGSEQAMEAMARGALRHIEKFEARIKRRKRKH